MNIVLNTAQGLVTPGGMPLVNADGSLNVNALRTNALLQDDEWQQMDEAVLGVLRFSRPGIMDLRDRGLTRNLGGLGVVTSEWQNVSDMDDAEINMDATTRAEEGAAAFSTQGVPVPIFSKGYRLNMRYLMASRRMGQSMDTIQTQQATRKVQDKMDYTLFQGASITGQDGYSIYGYCTHPSRLRANIGTAWDASSPDPVGDVNRWLDELYLKGFEGPFGLYVPREYSKVLREDYDTYKDGTYLDRILALDPALQFVKPTKSLGSKEAVLVQLSADVVDLAIGQDITNIQWDERGGLTVHMQVMAAVAPRLKTVENESGNTVLGVLHAFESGTSTTT
jgi:uncharacterized linocin/CFP29 family protein